MYQHLYLIGLTGNIACGKSTVLKQLHALGAHTTDADSVTRQLQAPGQPVYQAIVAAFGPEICLTPDGPLDRARLGAIVFSDPAALAQLEQIVHPAVHVALHNWLRTIPPAPVGAPVPVAVIDAIKLIENGWKTYSDAIWVVTCAPEQQLARLMQTRGLSEQEAQLRMMAQPPQHDKMIHADVVIDNSGTLEGTRTQVLTAWQQIPR